MPSWLRGFGHRPHEEEAAKKSLPRLTELTEAMKTYAPATLTIFDWDDTLLCTSELLQRGGVPPTRSFFSRGPLRRLEDAARRLLTHAIEAGPVYIVTNASLEWVVASAEKHMPRLAPMLSKVNLVSASDTWKAQFPGQGERWKALSFLEIARDLDMGSISNLVVIGDSESEMSAADAVGAAYTSVRVKAFKLLEQPSAQDLEGELRLVRQSFDKILQAERDVTVTLEGEDRRSPPTSPLRRPASSPF